MSSAEVEVLLEPRDDDAGLRVGCVEALLTGEGHELVRRLAGLRLDVVEVRLE
jgi:hypothetical protein